MKTGGKNISGSRRASVKDLGMFKEQGKNANMTGASDRWEKEWGSENKVIGRK